MTSTCKLSERSSSKRLGELLANTRLSIRIATNADEPGFMPAAGIPVRPVNYTVVTFELALERDDVSFAQRYPAGDVDVVLHGIRSGRTHRDDEALMHSTIRSAQSEHAAYDARVAYFHIARTAIARSQSVADCDGRTRRARSGNRCEY